MNILYLAFTEDTSFSGVSNKIKQQSKALAIYADMVFLFIADYRFGFTLYLFDKIKKELKVVEHKQFIYKSNYIKIYSFYSIAVSKKIIEICKTKNINVIYYRKSTLLPCMVNMFIKIKLISDIITVCELPTYPYAREYLNQNKYLALICDNILFNIFKKISSHFFVITDYKNEAKIKLKKWTRISNGIDVNAISVRSNPPDLSEGLHLLGVANISFWHGYDRVIEGLHRYYENDPHAFPVFFHIVGIGGANHSLETLTTKHNLEHRVFFHGAVYGEELDNLFKKYHIAVGSLGVHRIDLSEAFTLKAREYCARGIPFIMSQRDPDFGEDFPYIYKISSDDTPVDIPTVLVFARAVLDEKKLAAGKMRSFALSHLDWRIKMEKVYSVISALVEKNK